MSNTIKHANIIYMPTISALGGIETYVYEMVKKYKNLDIAVVSKNCDPAQAKRIKQYCKLYIHHQQEIECKVAIINYDTSIIDYIKEGAKIYETIHGDYTNTKIYKGKIPPDHPRLTGFIAITNYLKNGIKDLLHTDKEIRLCYNPLTIEKKKCITLVSATRLHATKGKNRIEKLATTLDQAGIDYIWYIITGDIGGIDSPNVIFIKNRLDVWKWIDQADYVVLLSDSEACSYTLNEALYRNIPIITTPLPYLEEIGVKDGVNSYILNFDCSNIDHIVKNIQNIPKFNFKKMKDSYQNIFAKSTSTYKPDNIIYKVEAIENFTLDNYSMLKNIIKKTVTDKNNAFTKGDIFECDEAMKNYLTGDNSLKKSVIKILEETE